MVHMFSRASPLSVRERWAGFVTSGQVCTHASIRKTASATSRGARVHRDVDTVAESETATLVILVSMLQLMTGFSRTIVDSVSNIDVLVVPAQDSIRRAPWSRRRISTAPGGCSAASNRWRENVSALKYTS